MKNMTDIKAERDILIKSLLKPSGSFSEIFLFLIIFLYSGAFISITGIFVSFIWLAHISPSEPSITHCHAMFDHGTTFYITNTQHIIFRTFTITTPIFISLGALSMFVFAGRKENPKAFRGNLREWLILITGICLILLLLTSFYIPYTSDLFQNLFNQHPMCLICIVFIFVIFLVCWLVLGLTWAKQHKHSEKK